MGLSVVGWKRCVPLSLTPVSLGAFLADLALREENPPRSYGDFAITLLTLLLTPPPGEPPPAG
ncbi:MAG: hypothetical protein ACTSP1_09495 [Candidatus Freyarchaeota archaeon]